MALRVRQYEEELIDLLKSGSTGGRYSFNRVGDVLEIKYPGIKQPLRLRMGVAGAGPLGPVMNVAAGSGTGGYMELPQLSAHMNQSGDVIMQGTTSLHMLARRVEETRGLALHRSGNQTWNAIFSSTLSGGSEGLPPGQLPPHHGGTDIRNRAAQKVLFNQSWFDPSVDPTSGRVRGQTNQVPPWIGNEITEYVYNAFQTGTERIPGTQSTLPAFRGHVFGEEGALEPVGLHIRNGRIYSPTSPAGFVKNPSLHAGGTVPLMYMKRNAAGVLEPVQPGEIAPGSTDRLIRPNVYTEGGDRPMAERMRVLISSTAEPLIPGGGFEFSPTYQMPGVAAVGDITRESVDIPRSLLSAIISGQSRLEQGIRPGDQISPFSSYRVGSIVTGETRQDIMRRQGANPGDVLSTSLLVPRSMVPSGMDESAFLSQVIQSTGMAANYTLSDKATLLVRSLTNTSAKYRGDVKVGVSPTGEAGYVGEGPDATQIDLFTAGIKNTQFISQGWFGARTKEEQFGLFREWAKLGHRSTRGQLANWVEETYGGEGSIIDPNAVAAKYASLTRGKQNFVGDELIGNIFQETILNRKQTRATTEFANRMGVRMVGGQLGPTIHMAASNVQEVRSAFEAEGKDINQFYQITAGENGLFNVRAILEQGAMVVDAGLRSVVEWGARNRPNLEALRGIQRLFPNFAKEVGISPNLPDLRATNSVLSLRALYGFNAITEGALRNEAQAEPSNYKTVTQRQFDQLSSWLQKNDTAGVQPSQILGVMQEIFGGDVNTMLKAENTGTVFPSPAQIGELAFTGEFEQTAGLFHAYQKGVTDLAKAQGRRVATPEELQNTPKSDLDRYYLSQGEARAAGLTAIDPLVKAVSKIFGARGEATKTVLGREAPGMSGRYLHIPELGIDAQGRNEMYLPGVGDRETLYRTMGYSPKEAARLARSEEEVEGIMIRQPIGALEEQLVPSVILPRGRMVERLGEQRVSEIEKNVKFRGMAYTGLSFPRRTAGDLDADPYQFIGAKGLSPAAISDLRLRGGVTGADAEGRVLTEDLASATSAARAAVQDVGGNVLQKIFSKAGWHPIAEFQKAAEEYRANKKNMGFAYRLRNAMIPAMEAAGMPDEQVSRAYSGMQGPYTYGLDLKGRGRHAEASPLVASIAKSSFEEGRGGFQFKVGTTRKDWRSGRQSNFYLPTEGNFVGQEWHEFGRALVTSAAMDVPIGDKTEGKIVTDEALAAWFSLGEDFQSNLGKITANPAEREQTMRDYMGSLSTQNLLHVPAIMASLSTGMRKLLSTGNPDQVNRAVTFLNNYGGEGFADTIIASGTMSAIERREEVSAGQIQHAMANLPAGQARDWLSNFMVSIGLTHPSVSPTGPSVNTRVEKVRTGATQIVHPGGSAAVLVSSGTVGSTKARGQTLRAGGGGGGGGGGMVPPEGGPPATAAANGGMARGGGGGGFNRAAEEWAYNKQLARAPRLISGVRDAASVVEGAPEWEAEVRSRLGAMGIFEDDLKMGIRAAYETKPQLAKELVGGDLLRRGRRIESAYRALDQGLYLGVKKSAFSSDEQGRLEEILRGTSGETASRINMENLPTGGKANALDAVDRWIGQMERAQKTVSRLADKLREFDENASGAADTTVSLSKAERDLMKSRGITTPTQATATSEQLVQNIANARAAKAQLISALGAGETPSSSVLAAAGFVQGEDGGWNPPGEGGTGGGGGGKGGKGWGGAARRLLGGFGMMYMRTVGNLIVPDTYGYADRARFDETMYGTLGSSLGGAPIPQSLAQRVANARALSGGSYDVKTAMGMLGAQFPGVQMFASSAVSGIGAFGATEWFAGNIEAAAPEFAKKLMGAAVPIGIGVAAASMLAQGYAASQDTSGTGWRTAQWNKGITDAFGSFTGNNIIGLKTITGTPMFARPDVQIANMFNLFGAGGRQRAQETARMTQLYTSALNLIENRGMSGALGGGYTASQIGEALTRSFLDAYGGDQTAMASVGAFYTLNNLPTNGSAIRNLQAQYQSGINPMAAPASLLAAGGFSTGRVMGANGPSMAAQIAYTLAKKGNILNSQEMEALNAGVQTLANNPAAQYIPGFGVYGGEANIDMLRQRYTPTVNIDRYGRRSSTRTPSETEMRAFWQRDVALEASALEGRQLDMYSLQSQVWAARNQYGIAEGAAPTPFDYSGRQFTTSQVRRAQANAQDTLGLLQGLSQGGAYQWGLAAQQGANLGAYTLTGQSGMQMRGEYLAFTGAYGEWAGGAAGRVTGGAWGQMSLALPGKGGPSVSSREMANRIWGAGSGQGTGMGDRMIRSMTEGVTIPGGGVQMPDGSTMTRVGGEFGWRFEQNAIQYENAMASVGIQMRGIQLDKAFTTGVGLNRFAGTVNPQTGQPFGFNTGKWSFNVPGIAGFTSTGGGQWGYEDVQRQMGYAQQEFGFQMQQKQMTLNKNQFFENMGLQWSSAQQSRGWTRADWQYQDTTRNLQWQWQQEDFQENSRFMTGRERRLAQRQMNRATTMHNLEDDQIDKTRDRQKKLWSDEDRRFQIQIKQFSETRRLQEEEFEVTKRFYEERKRLEEEYVKLQRAQWVEQMKLQEQSAGLTAKIAKDQKDLNDKMTKYDLFVTNMKNTMETMPFSEFEKAIDSIPGLTKSIIDLINSMAGAAGVATSKPYVKEFASTSAPPKKTSAQAGSAKAAGGPLGFGVDSVGEAGFEFVVGGNVIPHDTSAALAMMGLRPGANVGQAAQKIDQYMNRSVIPNRRMGVSAAGGQVLNVFIGTEKIASFVIDAVSRELRA